MQISRMMNRVPEGKFVLTADLNFAEVETAYVTETFTGSLDGQAHGVSGIRGPLFAVLSGTVENLRFRNIFVKNEDAGANVLAVETKKCHGKKCTFQRNYFKRSELHRTGWKRSGLCL